MARKDLRKKAVEEVPEESAEEMESEAESDEGEEQEDVEESEDLDDEASYDINADSDSAPQREGGDENEDEEPVDKEQLMKDAKAYRDALDRRGVIYMGRVPPFMKPNKLRTLLEPYGEITRLFLAEEDAELRRKRKERGGNSSRQFREGWVEFRDKKVAKKVAASLNNTQMGGRKGDYYHDDMWNLKYLRHFKWEYLTEKFAYERRVRETKLRAAMQQAKRGNAEMADLIQRTKVQQAIQAKKRARDEASGVPAGQAPAGEGDGMAPLKRRFHQRALFNTDGTGKKATSKVLAGIFPQAR